MSELRTCTWTHHTVLFNYIWAFNVALPCNDKITARNDTTMTVFRYVLKGIETNGPEGLTINLIYKQQQAETLIWPVTVHEYRLFLTSFCGQIQISFHAVLRTNGVRGSDDGASGLQRGDDAGFGDGDTLLLHGLVDTRPVCIIHLEHTVWSDVCLLWQKRTIWTE